jgi:hypothetical protein
MIKLSCFKSNKSMVNREISINKKLIDGYLNEISDLQWEISILYWIYVSDNISST